MNCVSTSRRICSLAIGFIYIAFSVLGCFGNTLARKLHSEMAFPIPPITQIILNLHWLMFLMIGCCGAIMLVLKDYICASRSAQRLNWVALIMLPVLVYAYGIFVIIPLGGSIEWVP
jgi:hypothetical protein